MKKIIAIASALAAAGAGIFAGFRLYQKKTKGTAGVSCTSK